ncbi:DUF5856 family protein [Dysgonomonas sp. 520]|uniref:DUF5856 family protein n=1 Tax=Dysgonomonas sp. 520 TaxID=2302931 RepID=UPI002102E378|nr:DUF5856 family protein [Dysgonomonas sp. 520]
MKDITKTKNTEVAEYIGSLFAFNSSLKLYHWHVTGKGSYAQHMALDQAIDDLLDVIDRITETSIAMLGDLDIVIPETKTPTDIVKHVTDFYNCAEAGRELFTEAFTQSIIDDYVEAIQQLRYRLIRLQ